jgi:hypothetical protein
VLLVFISVRLAEELHLRPATLEERALDERHGRDDLEVGGRRAGHRQHPLQHVELAPEAPEVDAGD